MTVLKDLAANAGMLVAFVSICYQIFRNTGLTPSSPIKYKILFGGIFGLLGVILMEFGVHLPSNLMVDYRYLAVILSAISGGWLPAVISGLIISVCRILLNGINRSSITAVVVMLILIIFYCIITQLKIRKYLKWVLSVAVSMIVVNTSFIILIDEPLLEKEVVIYFSLGFTIASTLLYYYLKYIEAATESYRRYRLAANKDFLTGLNNIRQFDSLYNSIIENVRQKQIDVSLLYIDIDYFKKINDTYGHKEGDIVLKSLGEIFTRTCRNIDTVSRIGGEEFAVVLTDCTPDMAVEIAERIRKAVETNPFYLSDKTKINITVSIGISSYPDLINDFERLREKADEALYEAKHTGRNKVILSH